MYNDIANAVDAIRRANHVCAFTGAGISVESGIPPFRGETGLWSRYDPIILDTGYFFEHPAESWRVIKDIFYDSFGKASPNEAHLALARMEAHSFLDAIITQNIDNLHQAAGSKKVYEYHGTVTTLSCTRCGHTFDAKDISLNTLPPKCSRCGGVLKPDFVFFGEAIPHKARTGALEEARQSDVFIVIGTTGEIMPASQIPSMAKANHALIIEINPEETAFTRKITDIFLNAKATVMMQLLEEGLEADR
ncbi:MAG: NAD-dependent deacylase [Thermodesulfobacteriota bacterium]|nr:NAD-dependent deacylase [Thermodesulfobacteriota bacterium]